MIRVGILTISDRSFKKEREDKSGELIRSIIMEWGGSVDSYGIVPDEGNVIVKELIKLTDEMNLDLVLTSGGTGLAERDVTPEATRKVIEREVPGIAEEMRRYGREKTIYALLSRAIAGSRGQALIINLPGNPRAVQECLEAILPVLSHAIEILHGKTDECAHLSQCQ